MVQNNNQVLNEQLNNFPGVGLPFLEWFCQHYLGIKISIERYPESKHGPIPEDLTTAQVCELFIKPETKNCFGSYIDYLKAEGIDSTYIPERSPKPTGQFWNKQATHFVSHAWQSSFMGMIRELVKFGHTQYPNQMRYPFLGGEIYSSNVGPYFWIDLFCINQHVPLKQGLDSFLDDFRKSVAQINHSVLVMHPANKPFAITRSWCLWEMYCSLSHQTKVSILLGDSEQLASNLQEYHLELLQNIKKIDLSSSKASIKNEAEIILKHVEKDVGVAKMNEFLVTRMLSALMGIATKQNNAALVEQLLNEGASDTFTGTDQDIVGMACELGSYPVIRALQQASINLKGLHIAHSRTDAYFGTVKYTALSIAAHYGHMYLLNDMLNGLDLDVNERNEDGTTVLHVVCMWQCATEIVRATMAKKLLHFDPNLAFIENADNQIPIHGACWTYFNDTQLIDELLFHDKDRRSLRWKDKNGNTPIEFALKNARMLVSSSDTTSEYKTNKKFLSDLMKLKKYLKEA